MSHIVSGSREDDQPAVDIVAATQSNTTLQVSLLSFMCHTVICYSYMMDRKTTCVHSVTSKMHSCYLIVKLSAFLC